MSKPVVIPCCHTPRSRALKALWLLVLFVGYQWAVLGFTHTHIINGVTIVHSHPFTSAHDHQAGSYIQLAQLSHFLTTEVSEVTIARPQLPLLAALEVLPAVPMHSGIHLNLPLLRAPPQECLFI
ncbi:MAG: hypothetical protein ACI4C3_07350 [Bacteroides sp.]